MDYGRLTFLIVSLMLLPVGEGVLVGIPSGESHSVVTQFTSCVNAFPPPCLCKK